MFIAFFCWQLADLRKLSLYFNELIDSRMSLSQLSYVNLNPFRHILRERSTTLNRACPLEMILRVRVDILLLVFFETKSMDTFKGLPFGILWVNAAPFEPIGWTSVALASGCSWYLALIWCVVIVGAQIYWLILLPKIWVQGIVLTSL